MSLINRYFTDGRDIKEYFTFRTTTIKMYDDQLEYLILDIPEQWSDQSVGIVASKYFWGERGTNERENSIFKLCDRVIKWIVNESIVQSIITEKESSIFYDELMYIVLDQRAAWNSPVWFNVGISKHDNPQTSACFIQSVEDNLNSILDLQRSEAILFKFGSGTGTNLSSLRSKKEKITGGGKSSGVVEFMKGYDSWANIIKSGGITRRAAKMNIINVDHLDVLDFISAKADEERKAHILIDGGVDGSLNGDAYGTVSFQNLNASIRVYDKFMQSVIKNKEWKLKGVKDDISEKIKATDIFNKIAEEAHFCGDPGIQFHDKINEYNPVKNSGIIDSSNPCSEYMFLSDSACNLSSVNLIKYLDDNGKFMTNDFIHTVKTMIISMESLINSSSYPTEKIHKNSIEFRPLGIGFANLGGLLMNCGIAYDSDQGRYIATTITSLLTAVGYHTSAEIAKNIGAFEHWKKNKRSFLSVLNKHKNGWSNVIEITDPVDSYEYIVEMTKTIWDNTINIASDHGVRNAQISVLAPTGTIGLMMDCDTTGIEPDYALVKTKTLAGGGYIEIINRQIPFALSRLGYNDEQINDILKYVSKYKNVDNAPHIKEEDLSIFDTAIKMENSKRYIGAMGHIKMMSSVQPFLSGAISKTVNLPNEATVNDFKEIYMRSWNLGLKSVALYRDGSKRIQPLNIDGNKTYNSKIFRKVLPADVVSKRHQFQVGIHKGRLIIGEDNDGNPMELFIIMSKMGTLNRGILDAIGILISKMFQYGIPLNEITKSFQHMRFEPSGFTGNQDIPMAESILDYIGKWLDLKYGERKPIINGNYELLQNRTGNICPVCGGEIIKTGSCTTCTRCGEASGCS
jgi:ribonucleoside-diphosphate reductase alpha chain